MGWILFIIQLVIAMPKLIAAVKEIIELIKMLPKPEQAAAKKKLMAAARRANKNRNQVASETELNQMKAELKQRLGVK